jgi:hypothetical protein
VGEPETPVRGRSERGGANLVLRECSRGREPHAKVGMGVGGSEVLGELVLGVSKRRRATSGPGPVSRVDVGSGGPSADRFLPPRPKTLSIKRPLSRLSGEPRSGLCGMCLPMRQRPGCLHDPPHGSDVGTPSSKLASCSLCLAETNVEHNAIWTARCAEQLVELCGLPVLGLQGQSYFLLCARVPV